MKLVALPPSAWRPVTRVFVFILLSVLVSVPVSLAQTSQPVLFAVSTSNGQYSASTFLRDDTAGSLTLLSTSAPFKNPCIPQAIDAKGRFLFGICGEGLSLYTYDAASGTVAEVPASPFAVSTGNSGTLIVAESTGQYVYLLKVNYAGGPSSQSLFLDTFQIDPVTPALIPLTTQTLPVAGTWVISVGDPNQHGMAIFLNQNVTAALYPTAILYTIAFDPTTGIPTLDPTGGQNVGYNARTMAISPTGKYLATGLGEGTGSFTTYQLGASSFTLTSLGSHSLGVESAGISFPDSIYFDPNGELIYVQAPPANYSGGGLPFLIFDTATFLQLPSSPLLLADAAFASYLKDSQGPFAYAANSANGANGISVYLIDPGTGLASQPGPINAPFSPQLNITPMLAPFGPSGGQGIGGPALTPSAESLAFSPTVIGQKSGPQIITLSSTGQESVSLSSISLGGANPTDFLESDTCLSAPVLKPNATCTISITYSPSVIGTSQASLFIADNAPGSPQQISLAGTAVATPPPAPVVTLNPPATLTFPGTLTQDTPSLPQSITLTNSGNAPLQISAMVLNGQNIGDFTINSNSCAGSVAANATCTVSLVFTPLAAGLRTTTLIITDNAANSPQSVTLSGTGAPAITINPTIGGSTTASVSAGQPAQFNLVATASGNFTGTLTFTCTGAPFVATCTVPASVSITNGAPVSFTVSVSTTVVSGSLPLPLKPSDPWARPSPMFLRLVATLCVVCILLLARRPDSSKFNSWHSPLSAALVLFLAAILASGIGCGSAGSSVSTAQQKPTPAVQTAATPAMQPTGGTISTGYPSVIIADSTPGSTIYYTTDGSTPTASSAVYASAFTVKVPTTVQAIAAAPSYTTSAVASASYKFQTPSGTFTLALTPTAIAAGSSKQLLLSPISLTLTVK
jgi:hypothetical protein